MAIDRSKRPIGIFDSGIGGLTVANAILKLLPNEEIIYFGDTAHLPYGDKSPDSIRYYSLKICKYFIDLGCKAIVIACNTAASVAAHDIQDFYGNEILIINVVDPLINAISRSNYSKVGVIATKATTDSEVYPIQLKHFNPALKVTTLAAPLLVPMIEENLIHNDISQIVLKNYLKDPAFDNIEALLLACTHYPLIKKEIFELLEDKVAIFDSSVSTANYLKSKLVDLALLNDQKENLDQFIFSQFNPSFEKTTALFFGNEVHLTEVDIWGEKQWPTK